MIRTETDRQDVLRFIAHLNIEGRAWAVTVVKHTKKRSLLQNSLLHLWLAKIAKETGNSIDDVKEGYREMFMGKVPHPFNSGKVIGKSTTSLTKEEFSDLLDQIHAHATQDYGIMLPQPDELWYDEDGRAA